MIRTLRLIAISCCLLAPICLAPPAFGDFPQRVFVPVLTALSGSAPPLDRVQAETGQDFFTLASVSSLDGCKPAWNGVVPLGGDRYMEQIEGVRALGGDVIVAFGGAQGPDLAASCPSAVALRDAYQEVIDDYGLTWVVFHVKGDALTDEAAVDRRNEALLGLQADNPGLRIAYALPATPAGLAPEGVQLLERADEAGVRVDLVNIMAMDFGANSAPEPEGRMGGYVIDAAESTREQLLARGWPVEIGVTPMIGHPRNNGEQFHLFDAMELLVWAGSTGWVTLLSRGRPLEMRVFMTASTRRPSSPALPGRFWSSQKP